MVKRRKFVIGLGALVAGSGAALGTGASVSSTMDRDANVNVVNDSDGLLAIVVSEDVESDVLRETGDGEFTIDFTANGNADGVNVDSQYQIGSLFDVGAPMNTDGNSPTVNPAFQIVNNDTVPRSVTVEYQHTGSLNQNGSKMIIQARPAPNNLVGNGEPTKNLVVEDGSTNPSATFTTGAAGGSRDDRLQSAGAIGFSILVDTTGSGATKQEDLGGTLRISSN
jgi:hypothetical protein